MRVLKQIQKLAMAGLIIGVMATPSLACYLGAGAYSIQGGGTGGGPGPYINGTIKFTGGDTSGTVSAVVYGHWYGDKECVMQMTGDYTTSGSPVGTGPGIVYNVNVVSSNIEGNPMSGCMPAKGLKNQLILIPEADGSRYKWGTYKANSNMWGSGEEQQ